MKFKLVFAVIVFYFTCTSLAQTDDLIGSSFSRGAHGEVSRYSAQQLRNMINKAQQEGSIGVWLAFNVPWSMSMTQTEIEQLHANIGAMYAAIVQPLIQHNAVWPLETPSGFENAPGVALTVSAIGLRELAKSRDVKYITYYHQGN